VTSLQDLAMIIIIIFLKTTFYWALSLGCVQCYPYFSSFNSPNSSSLVKKSMPRRSKWSPTKVTHSLQGLNQDLSPKLFDSKALARDKLIPASTHVTHPKRLVTQPATASGHSEEDCASFRSSQVGSGERGCLPFINVHVKNDTLQKKTK
jgi:hypothetical protein